MSTIHIPNDTSQATQATIDAALPGDELIFDAGYYVFHKTLYLLPDRHYHIECQVLERGDPFDGDALIECPADVLIDGGGNHFGNNNLLIHTS